MNKKWMFTAIGLIIIGVVGLFMTKFDLGSPKYITFEKKWDFHAQELKTISVDSSSDNIEVEFIESPSDTGFIQLEGDFTSKIIDKINAASIAGDRFLLDLKTKFEFNLVMFDFSNPKTHITIALPQQHELNALDVSVQSGNIKAKNILARNASISTRSGNLSILDTTNESLILSAISGNITAEDITSKLNTSTSSGNIKLTNISGDLVSKAISGNTTVIQKEIGSADIEIKSGNANFKIAEGFSGIYDLRTNSGDVKSPDLIGTSNDIIKIRTISGNINVHK